MDFEWDENKARANLAKHKLDFTAAIRVFLDPFRLEAIDDRQDYQETRFKVIGKVGKLNFGDCLHKTREKIPPNFSKES
jgi:uncharacterized DUF497 family protein